MDIRFSFTLRPSLVLPNSSTAHLSHRGRDPELTTPIPERAGPGRSSIACETLFVTAPFVIPETYLVPGERLQKNLPQVVVQIVERMAPEDNRPVIIMAQDEGRFGRITDIRPCWAPKGIRPKVSLQVVRTFVYVYAAVCMAMGRISSLILPYANAAMMNLFLEEVSNDFKDYFVIMLVDGAGWHTSHGLKIPETIRLIQQPAHSPELNPVEHLWEELREKYLPNKAFKSLDRVEEALCKGLRELHNDPERVRSMTNFPYLQVTY